MAVDAHQIHVFPSQLLRNREVLNAMENYTAAGSGASSQMLLPVSGEASFPFLAFHGSATSPEAAASLSRKRARDPDRVVSFLGEDISSHIQNQMQDVDRLLAQHTAKVRLELAEKRRRFWRLALAAAEEEAAKRLRAKEEEVERAGKLNWALEERVRSLCVENQIWRDLAQANEAAANALRSNLEQVLAAQVRMKEEQKGSSPAEDAESCCCGDNNNNAEEERRDTAATAAPAGKRRVCRNCGETEPSVLLLPCRHLCLCGTCAPAINACPICKCAKDGSVNVNIF